MVPIGAGQQWRTSWGPAPSWATTRSPERPTFGPVIAKASRLLGRPLFPWQRFVADVAGEVLPDGSAAYSTIVMVVPRRAGKNALVEAKIFQAGTEGPRRTIWMTGQKRDNAVKRWGDLRKSLAGAKDELVRSMARSRISQGSEVLRFPNGSEFRPFAPDEDSMHGEAPALVLVDELWSQSLTDMKLIQAGYRPQFAFEPGQEWKFSAAGRAGLSGWLQHDRAAGRAAAMAGERSGVAYFEWSLDEDWARETADSAIADPGALADLMSAVMGVHPRPGIRRSYLEKEFRRDPSDFLRAYAGVDDLGAGGEMPVPLHLWRQAQWVQPDMTPDGVRVGLGVSIDGDGLEASICAAWRLADGRGLVQVVERAPRTRWVVGTLARIMDQWPDVDCVAIGNAGGERDVADQLRAELGEDKVLTLSVADDKAALERFRTGLTQGPVIFHDGKARPDLLDALRVARVSRGQWEPRPGQLEPVTPLPAAHRAVWAADHLPERPAVRPRFTVL